MDGKSKSDGLEILGDQKVAPVARGFRVQSVYPRKLQHLLIVCQFVSLSVRHTLIHSPYVRTEYYSSAGSTLGRSQALGTCYRDFRGQDETTAFKNEPPHL